MKKNYLCICKQLIMIAELRGCVCVCVCEKLCHAKPKFSSLLTIDPEDGVSSLQVMHWQYSLCTFSFLWELNKPPHTKKIKLANRFVKINLLVQDPVDQRLLTLQKLGSRHSARGERAESYLGITLLQNLVVKNKLRKRITQSKSFSYCAKIFTQFLF